MAITKIKFVTNGFTYRILVILDQISHEIEAIFLYSWLDFSSNCGEFSLKFKIRFFDKLQLHLGQRLAI